MEAEELKKIIQNILFENYFDETPEEDDEDLGKWTGFDKDEMMGPAKKIAKKDIKKSGGTFEPLGKNRFEKNIDIDDLIADLEAQKQIKSAALKRIQTQIDQLQRFGGGSLNEENPNVNQDSKLDRPKDSAGQPITLRARVEDLTTGSVGRVMRFGIDDKNELTVHISWLKVNGEETPKTTTYPNKIIVKDDSRVVKEDEMDEDSLVFRHKAGQREKSRKEIPLGQHAPHSQAALTDESIGIGLSVKKGMNVKPTHGR